MSRTKYQECEQCGDYIGGDEGFPRLCGRCHNDDYPTGDAIDQAMAAMEIKQEMQAMQEECYQLLKTG